MTTPDTCTQCGQTTPTCKKCGDRIIFVPRQGFGNTGEWRHVEPPRNDVGHHLPHPALVISVSDDVMQLDEHRPAADASRPLQVGQRFRGLTPALLEHAEPRECWSLRQARYLSAGGRDVTPPMHCRLLIVPGDHYILWTERNIDGRPTGKTEAYCAPCAIREWHFADVREVPA